MAQFKLNKTEINTKSAKYLYEVKDENGQVLQSRKSNRDYVACTVDGQFYFGRLDLIGKGDHGLSLRVANGAGYDAKTGKFVPGKCAPNQSSIDRLNSIAYL